MSARIIKAHSVHAAQSAEAFNLVDLRRQGEEFIASAKREAQEIIDQATRAAVVQRELVLNEARELGRHEGMADAAEMIRQQADVIAERLVTDRLTTALPALLAAAESLQSERDRWLVRWEHTAVKLGVSIAGKLLQRQLAARPELATVIISDALQLAAGQPLLTVYMHPEDLAAWGDRGTHIVQSLTACADTTLVPDPLAMRGGCRIVTRHGEIDARVETMLLRIAEELIED